MGTISEVKADIIDIFDQSCCEAPAKKTLLSTTVDDMLLLLDKHPEIRSPKFRLTSDRRLEASWDGAKTHMTVTPTGYQGYRVICSRANPKGCSHEYLEIELEEFRELNFFKEMCK